jgi:TPR repeat protein
MRFRVCLMGLFLAFLLSSCSVSHYNLNEGIRSFQVQDYRQAFIRLKPEARKGQRDAQYAVGYMYYYGQGVVEDRQKAWYWINCAAQAGQADAIEALKLLGASFHQQREHVTGVNQEK